jgi:Kef-type K+ transport system membrane component KefB
MSYTEPEIWPPYLLLGATLASVAIAFILYRLRCRAVPAAIIGGVVPGAAIFGTCYWLDVILCAQLGDDNRNSG